MHVVSLFPSFFNYALFGPLVLRAAIGLFFCLVGFDVGKKNTSTDPAATPTVPAEANKMSIYGYICFVLSILFIVGLATQAAAIVAILLIIGNAAFRGRLLAASNTSNEAFMLVVVICLSLLFLGAGAPAIDLPL